MFPRTLKRFSLIRCQATMPRPARYLQSMEQLMTNLEELSLEHCPWFQTHDMLVISKLPQLKKLSLRGNHQLKEFVPYGSICARFGFKTLHVGYIWSQESF